MTWGARACLIAALLAATNSLADDRDQASYSAGERDVAGRFMGGTEMRNLAAHGGRLYAGNGYWKDQPGPEGRQGAQILVLDGAAARWRVEHSLEPRHLAIAALQSASFSMDHSGRPLARPVSMLFAGTWDLSGASQLMARNDASGTWTDIALPVPRVTSGIQQVRALATHRDRLFVGNDRHGILSGGYDPAAPGGIRWSEALELDVARLSPPSAPGLSLLRVSSFAACNGVLYAAIGQQIYRRVDSPSPRWELFYTNPRPGYSETGLRGLTALANSLLVAVEGDASRIIRIDPSTGAETTELDVRAFLDQRWGTRVGYVIAAYNDMAPVRGALFIGIEAFLPATAPVPAGHARVGGLDGGGWAIVRHDERRYDLRRVGATNSLVATRAIAASPFAGDADVVYFAGYDANKRPAHNTAWIFRGKATPER